MLSPPETAKDRDNLLVSLADEGQEMVLNLRHLQLKPSPCYRDAVVEPINLYHKVGHGKLDMFVISPARDSREVRDFLAKWASNDSRLFGSQKRKDAKDFQFPLHNMVSICALLVWQPANPQDTITRILFPGSTPQHKIFEGLDKIRHLEFLKHPTCTAQSLSPSASAVSLSSKQMKPKYTPTVIDKLLPGEGQTKTHSRPIASSEASKHHILKAATIPVAGAGDKVKTSSITKQTAKRVEKAIVKTDKPEKVDKEKAEVPEKSEKVDEPEKIKEIIAKDDDIILKELEKSETKTIMETAKMKENKANIESKEIVIRKRNASQSRERKVPKSVPKAADKKTEEKKVDEKKVDGEKKASPTTPKKSFDPKVNGVSKTTRASSRTRPSPSSTPAKSAKEANNRKVVESKLQSARAPSATRAPSKTVKKEEVTVMTATVKTERQPISRRPKMMSPSKVAKAPGSPAKTTVTKSTVYTTRTITKKPDGVAEKKEIAKEVTKTNGAGIRGKKPSAAALKDQEKAKAGKEEVSGEAKAVKDQETKETGQKDAEKISAGDNAAKEPGMLAEEKKPAEELRFEDEEEEEYLVIEKEEVYTEESAQEQVSAESHAPGNLGDQEDDDAEDEKLKRDTEESEKSKIAKEKEVAAAEKTSKHIEPEQRTVAAADKRKLSAGLITPEDKEKLVVEVEEIITSATEIVSKPDAKIEQAAVTKEDSDELHTEEDKKDTESYNLKETASAKSEPKQQDASPESRPSDKLNEDDVQKGVSADMKEETQPEEKVSTTSGATTAPTLPEDERMPLDEIKEVVEEKHALETTKESGQVPAQKAVPQGAAPPGRIGIDIRDPHIAALHRDIVKTPDEVADLPVDEEYEAHETRSDVVDAPRAADISPTDIIKKEVDELLQLKQMREELEKSEKEAVNESVVKESAEKIDQFEKDVDTKGEVTVDAGDLVKEKGPTRASLEELRILGYSVEDVTGPEIVREDKKYSQIEAGILEEPPLSPAPVAGAKPAPISIPPTSELSKVAQPFAESVPVSARADLRLDVSSGAVRAGRELQEELIHKTTDEPQHPEFVTVTPDSSPDVPRQVTDAKVVASRTVFKDDKVSKDEQERKDASRKSSVAEHDEGRTSSRKSSLADAAAEKESSRKPSVSNVTEEKVPSRKSSVAEPTEKPSSRKSSVSEEKAPSRKISVADVTAEKPSSRKSSVSDIEEKAPSRKTSVADTSSVKPSSRKSSVGDVEEKVPSRKPSVTDVSSVKPSSRKSSVSEEKAPSRKTSVADASSVKPSSVGNIAEEKAPSRKSSIAVEHVDSRKSSIALEKGDSRKSSVGGIDDIITSKTGASESSLQKDSLADVEAGKSEFRKASVAGSGKDEPIGNGNLQAEQDGESTKSPVTGLTEERSSSRKSSFGTKIDDAPLSRKSSFGGSAEKKDSSRKSSIAEDKDQAVSRSRHSSTASDVSDKKGVIGHFEEGASKDSEKVLTTTAIVHEKSGSVSETKTVESTTISPALSKTASQSSSPSLGRKASVPGKDIESLPTSGTSSPLPGSATKDDSMKDNLSTGKMSSAASGTSTPEHAVNGHVDSAVKDTSGIGKRSLTDSVVSSPAKSATPESGISPPRSPEKLTASEQSPARTQTSTPDLAKPDGKDTKIADQDSSSSPVPSASVSKDDKPSSQSGTSSPSHSQDTFQEKRESFSKATEQDSKPGETKTTTVGTNGFDMKDAKVSETSETDSLKTRRKSSVSFSPGDMQGRDDEREKGATTPSITVTECKTLVLQGEDSSDEELNVKEKTEVQKSAYAAHEKEALILDEDDDDGDQRGFVPIESPGAPSAQFDQSVPVEVKAIPAVAKTLESEETVIKEERSETTSNTSVTDLTSQSQTRVKETADTVKSTTSSFISSEIGSQGVTEVTKTVQEVSKEPSHASYSESNQQPSKFTAEEFLTKESTVSEVSALPAGIEFTTCPDMAEAKKDTKVEAGQFVSSAKESVTVETKDSQADSSSSTVHRMLVTASSEDGGEETEVCAAGSIKFTPSSSTSGSRKPSIDVDTEVAETAAKAVEKSLKAKEEEPEFRCVSKSVHEEYVSDDEAPPGGEVRRLSTVSTVTHYTTAPEDPSTDSPSHGVITKTVTTVTKIGDEEITTEITEQKISDEAVRTCHKVERSPSPRHKPHHGHMEESLFVDTTMKTVLSEGKSVTTMSDPVEPEKEEVSSVSTAPHAAVAGIRKESADFARSSTPGSDLYSDRDADIGPSTPHSDISSGQVSRAATNLWGSSEGRPDSEDDDVPGSPLSVASHMTQSPPPPHFDFEIGDPHRTMVSGHARDDYFAQEHKNAPLQHRRQTIASAMTTSYYGGLPSDQSEEDYGETPPLSAGIVDPMTSSIYVPSDSREEVMRDSFSRMIISGQNVMYDEDKAIDFERAMREHREARGEDFTRRLHTEDGLRSAGSSTVEEASEGTSYDSKTSSRRISEIGDLQESLYDSMSHAQSVPGRDETAATSEKTPTSLDKEWLSESDKSHDSKSGEEQGRSVIATTMSFLQSERLHDPASIESLQTSFIESLAHEAGPETRDSAVGSPGSKSVIRGDSRKSIDIGDVQSSFIEGLSHDAPEVVAATKADASKQEAGREDMIQSSLHHIADIQTQLNEKLAHVHPETVSVFVSHEAQKPSDPHVIEDAKELQSSFIEAVSHDATASSQATSERKDSVSSKSFSGKATEDLQDEFIESISHDAMSSSFIQEQPLSHGEISQGISVLHLEKREPKDDLQDKFVGGISHDAGRASIEYPEKTLKKEIQDDLQGKFEEAISHDVKGASTEYPEHVKREIKDDLQGKFVESISHDSRGSVDYPERVVRDIKDDLQEEFVESISHDARGQSTLYTEELPLKEVKDNLQEKFVESISHDSRGSLDYPERKVREITDDLQEEFAQSISHDARGQSTLYTETLPLKEAKDDIQDKFVESISHDARGSVDYPERKVREIKDDLQETFVESISHDAPGMSYVEHDPVQTKDDKSSLIKAPFQSTVTAGQKALQELSESYESTKESGKDAISKSIDAAKENIELAKAAGYTLPSGTADALQEAKTAGQRLATESEDTLREGQLTAKALAQEVISQTTSALQDVKASGEQVISKSAEAVSESIESAKSAARNQAVNTADALQETKAAGEEAISKSVEAVKEDVHAVKAAGEDVISKTASAVHEGIESAKAAGQEAVSKSADTFGEVKSAGEGVISKSADAVRGTIDSAKATGQEVAVKSAEAFREMKAAGLDGITKSAESMQASVDSARATGQEEATKSAEALQEAKSAGQDVIAKSSGAVHGGIESAKAAGQDVMSKSADAVKGAKDEVKSAFFGSFFSKSDPSSSKDKDPIASWGKPLGLPSPAPPVAATDNDQVIPSPKGTPQKERKLAAKNTLTDNKNKRTESPRRSNKSKSPPVYIDLSYVPHHGNSYYSSLEFFKRVRARYYVFSGIEPSREVYNALLEAKQTWEDKELGELDNVTCQVSVGLIGVSRLFCFVFQK